MPLGIGFMGNGTYKDIEGRKILVTNASRHWVHGEPLQISGTRLSNWVTNASRHWVHGELLGIDLPDFIHDFVTNASRHWVHGERCDELLALLSEVESQMPLGIGFMGNKDNFKAYVNFITGSQMPLGIGFMGNVS